jgi:hypothetical protein
MPVPYWIIEKGLPQIANGSEFAAVHASFQTWEDVATADVRFEYRGTTAASGVGRDGLNVVSFADAATPLGSSTIAATFSFFRSEIGSNNVISLVVDEADILFNPLLEFSTSAEENKFDIQSVLTHEVGHLLGLDHSALVSSVMAPFAAPSQLHQRTLAYDDIAGVTEIYPNPLALTGVGRIRGTIRSGNAAVFGANVVAVSSDGTSLVATLSQRDGSYVLQLLPPGSYRVFAEPLDLPVIKDNIGGGATGFYSTIRTDFGTTYFGNVSTLSEALTIPLTAGASATADILTLPPNATNLNLTRPAFGLRIARGSTGTLTLGGEGITAGVSFAASTPAVFLGSPTFGGGISSVAPTSARMALSISSTAPLGPKNIAVTSGAAGSILAGAFVVTDTNPSSIAVAPTNGPADGGTPVTITGANFREGAQVYFGGLAGTAVNIVNSGAILVNAPRNSPGPVNVVVVNSDGTWASAPRAFTYDALPPVITGVTPMSGPPTTLVTIEGENFDSHLQNVAVQFNGVSARIISATSRAITTIVPYGVTTGPITVSVFGRQVTGPVFTVTPAAVSRNLAMAAFNFIDASAASGGTSLNFNSNDDAVVSYPLPFNFSLFGDTYLAGSPVSITTNGFLSLEALSVAEFQNGALPGQRVVRPGGASGVVPPSLIAPFWDDLVTKGGSAVTTRIAGNAPNRQFVVQWSNMSILDEEGLDQNSSLTFEAVLFEGSNDVQFLYLSVSGPRSDGASATVGMQDLKRTTAVQSGFNEPIVSSEHFRTYRFDNGRYTEVLPDTTRPSMPLVSDEGALTANRTQLAAAWASADPESGIREFQYAIGTTPGGTEVKPFSPTTQNSAVVSGLGLQSGTTYYFTVQAVNGAGLVSDPGVSDGIRYDPAYQPQIKIISSAPMSNSEFTGLALLAPTAMNVVLRAYDANGSPVLGSGIRNPATISLAPGEQYAKLLTELFGFQTFDGWVEAEASQPGLSIFTSTGAWDMSALDGNVARETAADFVLFHAGASAVLVNPSSRAANVSMTSLVTKTTQTFSIPPRGLFVTALASAVRIRSTEALAAIERSSVPGRLTMNAAVPVTDAQSSLVFPHAVVGGGYKSTVLLANVGDTARTVQVAFGTPGASFLVQPNTVTPVPIGPAVSGITTGSVTVTVDGSLESRAIVAVLDIENETGFVTLSARPAATEFVFPYVVNGSGFFTGLAFATGSAPARITVEVYESRGGSPRFATIPLGANQQLGRLINELVAGVATQLGGYIRVRSDQPIWAWEIYGSGGVMASGPPLQ